MPFALFPCRSITINAPNFVNVANRRSFPFAMVPMADLEITLMKIYDLLIMGAGISGLITAQQLQHHPLRVGVLDKSRGVGGRLATRRWTGTNNLLYRVDHGAQYFTIRHPKAETLLKQWMNDTQISVKNWQDVHPRDTAYYFHQGMTQLAKHLAQPLIEQESLHLNERITVIRSVSGKPYRYEVDTDSGAIYGCHTLVLTAPVPQSLELLTRSQLPLSPDEHQTLSRIEYAPCITLLGHASHTSLPGSGAIKLSQHPTLAWIADNHVKDVSPHGPALSLQANPQWSHTHWNQSDEALTDLLIEAASQWITPADWEYTEVKKWRYALVDTPLDTKIYPLSQCPGIILAGDGFHGGRVEDALLSGVAAAEYCLTHAPQIPLQPK